MKTIEINLYSFDELSDKAKRKALKEYIENEDFYFIWDDAYETVKSFCKKTIIKTYQNSWLEPNFNNIDDSILNLTGVRLMKYFINNFDFLYKPKYLKSYDDHKTHRMIKNIIALNTGNKYSLAYSNIQKETSYNLTGVCYDDVFLKPIYDFLQKPTKNKNFEDIISDCFYCLKKSIENEIEYMQSMEYFAELCEMNNYYFTEQGEMKF